MNKMKKSILDEEKKMVKILAMQSKMLVTTPPVLPPLLPMLPLDPAIAISMGLEQLLCYP